MTFSPEVKKRFNLERIFVPLGHSMYLVLIYEVQMLKISMLFYLQNLSK